MADNTNILPHDQNFVRAAGFESSTQSGIVLAGKIIEATGRIKVDLAGATGTVTELDSGPGIKLTPDPIVTTGIIALVDSIAPIATLGTASQQIRVNAGATALEYFTPSSSGIVVGTTTVTSGTSTRVLFNNAGVVGEYVISGSGNVAMTTSPVFTTPSLGVATATSVNGLTITSSTGTLTIANGKTLTVSNSGTLAGGDAFVLAIAAAKTLTVSNTLTFTGTDSSSVAFGAGGTVLYTASTIPLTVGTTTITSGTNTRILYNNSGVLGEYTLTGTGTVVVMATSPTFTTGATTPQLLATANDSGALGASGTAFSDLFLASGAVINFAANNSAITHSSGILTVTAGELRITSANVGTNSDSVPTLSSTSTFTNKTLTSPTITTANLSGKQLLAEGASIALDPAGSADGAYSGITVTGVSGYSQAFGDLVYLAVADSRWEAADADAAATAGPVALAMVVVTGTDGNACTLLLQGIIRADAKFPAMTVGATQYVGETAGAIQGAIPTGADNIIRTVGYAITADELYFNPSTDWQVTVA